MRWNFPWIVMTSLEQEYAFANGLKGSVKRRISNTGAALLLYVRLNTDFTFFY